MQICLLYHDVFSHEPFESGFLRERDMPYKLRANLFEEHVRKVSEYCSDKGLSKDYVVFTFDDGGKSFHTVIAPILEKYGYRGVFFISTQYIGEDSFLNESEIQDLYSRGHIIGSHAHTHEHLYKLSNDQLKEEWAKSSSILSRIIGQPVLYASIPNGDTSKRVLEYAKECGFKFIYTSEPTTKRVLWKEMEIIGRYVLMSNCSSDTVVSIISSASKRLSLSIKRVFVKLIKAMLGEHYLAFKKTIQGQ